METAGMAGPQQAEAFEAELEDEGYEVLRRELPPGESLPEHAHAWDVRALVLAGEFTVETAERRETYRAGESFRLPAGTPHTEAHGPEGATLLLGRRHRPTGG
jgi:quercetin dioxygenase-like cupin family protein